MNHPDHAADATRDAAHPGLAEGYRRVRETSVSLTAGLSAEDMTVQSMPEVSPTKWHLAHTAWFFEAFILAERAPRYRPFDPNYHHLFNSYYYSQGDMHLRPERGLITRPGVETVLEYRVHVDAAMLELIEDAGEDRGLASLVTLGLNHEQQHQELILTDIKHVLSSNPTRPAYREDSCAPGPGCGPLTWSTGVEGVHEIGHDGRCFGYDNETPRHRVLIHPHEIADRPVTNAEYRAFVEDGGYRNHALWLSDGWSTLRSEGWSRPLYWSEDLSSEFTLAGEQAIDPHAPVSHLSFYEADAYARWADARLPTEAEWEAAASRTAITGNTLDSRRLHPIGAEAAGPRQFFGDVWEWTASAYAPYPGFRPLAGSLGEYNGKFMCNQMVIRGGSCVSWAEHLRASYRSFFYPHQRWQFTGLRLARDL